MLHTWPSDTCKKPGGITGCKYNLMFDLELDSNIERLEKNQAEAEFIIKKSGELIAFNQRAVDLFGYSCKAEMEKLHLKDLVPDDFAGLLPDEIGIEHLTKGEFLPRVNKRKNGSVFPSFVKTWPIIIGNESYVRTTVKKRFANQNIKQLMLEQNVEVLKCELIREKHRNFGFLSGGNQQRINQELCRMLREVHPNLNHKDMELASLISFNFETKAIASIQNICLNSAYVARKRLRKKLNLDKTQSLDRYFKQLVDNHTDD